MNTPNEFWLEVHRLSAAYAAEGLTSEERADNIVEQFRRMPRIARQETLNELVNIITHCPDIYTIAMAARNTAEAPAARTAALRLGAEKTA